MKNSRLSKNIMSLVLLTLLLKGIGFINKMIIAFYFGTTVSTDIYYNASGFVDSISSILIASLTVGIINIYISNKSNKGINEFISSVLSLMTFIMLIVSMVVCLSSNYIAFLLAPSYTANVQADLSVTIRLLAITFPFQGIIAVLSGLLQAEKRFIPVKMMGTVTSVVSIVCVVFLSKAIGINSLILSYIISVISNAVLLIICAKNIISYRLFFFRVNDDIKKIFVLMIPLFIGTAAHEVNLMVDKSISSGLSDGAISALAYSSVLYLFIENVIINSIVTASFPEITENIMKNNEKKASNNVHNVIFFAEVILIPIAVISVFFSESIVGLVFMRGNFDETSLILTSKSLIGYVVGLPMLAFRDVCMYTFYGYGNTKLPVYVNMIAVGLNIALDFVLSQYLGVLGISLATALSISVSAIVLGIFLKKDKKLYFNKEFCIEILKLLFISACIIVISAIISQHMYGKIFFVVIAIIAILFECLMLIMLKSKYMGNFYALIRNKILNR